MASIQGCNMPYISWHNQFITRKIQKFLCELATKIMRSHSIARFVFGVMWEHWLTVMNHELSTTFKITKIIRVVGELRADSYGKLVKIGFP